MTGRGAESSGLADRLRQATRALHAQAERSGIMRTLLTRRITRDDYCALLANLHAIYRAMENCFATHAQHAYVLPIADPLLFRSASIEVDLFALHGATWRTDLFLARATLAYVARIETYTTSDIERVIAHAYVRYLGDLNGGQMLEPIVKKTLGLHDAAGTQFYRFDVPDISEYALRYRASLDSLPVTWSRIGVIIEEAQWAFEQHIALFEELASP